MKRAWTLEELLANAEPDGKCLIWRGSYTTEGDPYATHCGARVPARRLVAQLSGVEVPAGHIVGRKMNCQNKGCICLAHAAVRSLSAHMRAATKRQVETPTSLANRRIAARRRGKLTTEQARSIRSDPSTLKELSERYGVCLQTISRIRRGTIWKECASPFAGLM